MFQNPYYPPYQPPAQRLQQYEQFRNPQNMLKCMAVTSIDEAQGTMIDLDGSVTVFADLSNGKIYMNCKDLSLRLPMRPRNGSRELKMLSWH